MQPLLSERGGVADGRDVGAIGLRRAVLEYRRAGHESIGAGARHFRRHLRRDAAVDLDVDWPSGSHGAQVAHLLDSFWNEFLSAEAGIDRHHQDQVHEIDDALDTCFRRARIHGDAHPLAECADRLQRAMDVRAGFDMHSDDVGARFGEGLEIRIARRDHQMHVERFLGVRPDRFDDIRADRNVRHEMTVHDVDMNPVSAGSIDRAHLLAELREIGSEDRRGDDQRARHCVLRYALSRNMPFGGGQRAPSQAGKSCRLPRGGSNFSPPPNPFAQKEHCATGTYMAVPVLHCNRPVPCIRRAWF